MVVPPNHPFEWDFSIIGHPFWGTTIFGNTHFLFWSWTDKAYKHGAKHAGTSRPTMLFFSNPGVQLPASWKTAGVVIFVPSI